MPSNSVTPRKMRHSQKLVKADSCKEHHPWLSFDMGTGNFHQILLVNKQISHGNPQRRNGFLHLNNHQPHLQCHEVCKSATEQSWTPHRVLPCQQHCRAQLCPARGAQPQSPSWLRQQQLWLIPVQVIMLCMTLWEGQSACSLLVGNVIRSKDFPESSRPQTNK